jgi:MFS family permease
MLVNKDGNLLGYITAFSLFWLNLGGWLAIAPAATMSLYGVKHYSKNYGTVFTAYGIGAIAGVLLSGFFKDIFHGYRQVFYMIIVLSLTGIGTAIRFHKGVLLKQS